MIKHNEILEERDRDQKPFNIYNYKMLGLLVNFLDQRFPFGKE